MKKIRIGILLLLLTSLLMGCNCDVELKVNNDYSGKIIYSFNKASASILGKDELVKTLKEGVDKQNDDYGGKFFKYSALEEDGDKYKFIVTFKANKKLFAKDQGIFIGTYKDFIKNNAILCKDIKVKAIGSNTSISPYEIKNKESLSVIYFELPSDSSSSVLNFTVSTEGRIKYHSDNSNYDSREKAVKLLDESSILILFQNTKDYTNYILILLLIYIVSIAGYAIFKSILKTCIKCGISFEKGSRFCSNCGEKIVKFKFNFSQLNKLIIFIPLIIIVILLILNFLIPALSLSLSSMSSNSKPNAATIKNILKNKELSGSEEDYDGATYKISNIKNIKINKNDVKDGHAKIKANVTFESGNYLVTSDIDLHLIKLSKWQFAYMNGDANIKPLKGPTDKEIQDYFEKLGSIETNSAIYSDISITENSLEVALKDDTGIEGNNTQQAFSITIKRPANTFTMDVSGNFSFADKSWTLDDYVVNVDTIKCTYKEPVPPTDLNLFKAYLGQNPLYIKDYAARVLTKLDVNKFKTLTFDKLSYNSDGDEISATLKADYEDSNLKYTGSWDYLAEYDKKSSNWYITLENSSSEVYGIKQVPVEDIERQIKNSKVKINDEYIDFSDKPDSFKGFKVLKQTLAGSKESIDVEIESVLSNGNAVKSNHVITYTYSSYFSDGLPIFDNID